MTFIQEGPHEVENGVQWACGHRKRETASKVELLCSRAPQIDLQQ